MSASESEVFLGGRLPYHHSIQQSIMIKASHTSSHLYHFIKSICMSFVTSEISEYRLASHSVSSRPEGEDEGGIGYIMSSHEAYCL